MAWGNDTISPAEAASLLQWWSEAGVDCLVEESPRNWLRPALPSETPRTSRTIAEPAAPIPDLPDQLDLFRSWLASTEDLPFHAPAAPRICPAGDPAAPLMLLTDMPSLEDCEAGTILSGEAGRLLDRMLEAIRLNRESVYCAALSCLRSPSGSFTDESAERCAALARHHIGLVAPKVVLLLGDSCTKALLGLGTIEARGRWHEISTQAGQIAAMATFTPSYLLDRPKAKRHAWTDLQMLIERIEA